MDNSYEAIGAAFVKQYYELFDDATRRSTLAQMYDQQAFMSFEGHQAAGQVAIKDKLERLSFQKIARECTSIDIQPMTDGVCVLVLGQLKTDDDPAHSFVQTFVLKNVSGGWFIFHDMFRLVLHHG